MVDNNGWTVRDDRCGDCCEVSTWSVEDEDGCVQHRIQLEEGGDTISMFVDEFLELAKQVKKYVEEKTNG